MRDLSLPFPEIEEIMATKSQDSSRSLLHNSPLLLVVEKWLRDDYKIANEIRKKKADGTIPTRWEVLSENMKEYGDKYFNYWN